MAIRQANTNDFMKPEFVGKKTEDYEVRDDGSVVRKDRWEMGIRSIGCALSIQSDWEVSEVVACTLKVIKAFNAETEAANLKSQISDSENRFLQAESFKLRAGPGDLLIMHYQNLYMSHGSLILDRHHYPSEKLATLKSKSHSGNIPQALWVGTMQVTRSKATELFHSVSVIGAE